MAWLPICADKILAKNTDQIWPLVRTKLRGREDPTLSSMAASSCPDGTESMRSTNDGCWASPRNSLRLNQTSPIEILAENNNRSKSVKSKRLTHPSERIFLLRVFLFTAHCVINTILFTLFICVAILVVPVCYCVRKTLLICSLRNDRDGMLRTMSSSDAMWLVNLASTKNTTPVSNIFFTFEGVISVDEIQNFISEKLLLQGPLRSNNLPLGKFKHVPIRIISGYGWKEISNLNISGYILERKEKSSLMPVDLTGISEVLDTCNLEKLWRILVFPNFDERDTGVLFQIHESLADIFPSSKVVLESLDYKTIYLKKQCFLLGRLATYFCACYRGPFVILKRLLMKKQRDFSLTPSQEASDSFHVSWSRAVDFKSVKRIKDITRTKGKNSDSVLCWCLVQYLSISFYISHSIITVLYIHSVDFLSRCLPWAKLWYEWDRCAHLKSRIKPQKETNLVIVEGVCSCGWPSCSVDP